MAAQENRRWKKAVAAEQRRARARREWPHGRTAAERRLLPRSSGERERDASGRLGEPPLKEGCRRGPAAREARERAPAGRGPRGSKKCITTPHRRVPSSDMANKLNSEFETVCP